MPSVDAEAPLAATDAADARLAAAGDARAFERLYRRHVARVHGLAGRMMGTGEAAELTQEVFVRAWQKLGTFRGEAAFGTWLYRLAVNLILARRTSRRIEWGRLAEDESLIERLPARSAASEHRLDLDTAIRRLPGGARQVFVLHDMEGYKHEEIAQMFGITSGTSKAQLHRARMLLRRHLGS